MVHRTQKSFDCGIQYLIRNSVGFLYLIIISNSHNELKYLIVQIIAPIYSVRYANVTKN